MEKMVPKELPYTTKSICPECFCTLEAEIYEEDGKVMIQEECKEHGEFKDVYWSNAEDFHRAFNFAYKGLGLENPRTENIAEELMKSEKTDETAREVVTKPEALPESENAKTEPAIRSQAYTVVSGDTLWDISGQLYENSF